MSFYKYAIAALIVLNFGVLAFVWFARPPKPPQGGRNGQNVVEVMMRELQFDDAQRKTYENLLSEHRKLRDQLDFDMQEQQERLFKGVATGDSSAIVQVKELKGALEMAIFNHFSNLRAICRPDQQVKFDALLIETLRNANPKPPVLKK